MVCTYIILEYVLISREQQLVLVTGDTFVSKSQLYKYKRYGHVAIANLEHNRIADSKKQGAKSTLQAL